ncbi:hypothetical protein FACS1894132_12690 [Clostridia bacterium]|nr:hypothetical protein FACS1894132_12690 [Clostridia bacterium]
MLSYLENDEVEKIKNMLSSDTKKEFNIDKQIKQACEFFVGKTVSYDKRITISGEDSYKKGEHNLCVIYPAIWDISTDENCNYYVSFSEYLINLSNKSKEGIYCIEICNIDTNEKVIIGDYLG